MKILLITLILGFSLQIMFSKNAVSKGEKSKYALDCTVVERDEFPFIRRCENSEVVCYLTNPNSYGSTQCKFKESVK